MASQQRWSSDPNPQTEVRRPLHAELREFSEFGTRTRVAVTEGQAPDGTSVEVATYINEYWTSEQRKGNSLHEVSYRACFKPQLPRFFIERLTAPGDRVYDPFMGRGTTLLEAALLSRVPMGCDVNPLSAILIRPRLSPPSPAEVRDRLASIDLREDQDVPQDLLVFYHPETLREIVALRAYLLGRERNGLIDAVDDWIRMVAVNRLTGHSPGFFSVYTLPPNQAVSVQSQRRINERRHQSPTRRDVPAIILRKTRSLLRGCDARVLDRLRASASRALLLTGPAAQSPAIRSGSVHLAVTSPPFLDVVDYTLDNWLRCWFCGIEPGSVAVSVFRKLEDWQAAMVEVFREVRRALKPGGHFAFEVGEVRKGQVLLEQAALSCGLEAGLEPVLVLINDQEFTKTSHCWGVRNRSGGTNTNRIVLFRKT